MKKTFKLLAFLFVFVPNELLFGQIWNGDIILTSQAQVDSFPIKYGALKYINGGLFVGNLDTSSTSDVTNLSPLSSLKALQKISIFNNNNLQNLTGLNQIDTVIFNIYIYRNKRLKNLVGLSGIRYFSDGGFNIRECDSIETLDGIGSIIRISNLYLTLNPRLKSLHGGNGIKSLSQLQLSENGTNTTTEGLDSLKRIFYLLIYKNNGIKHISGFNQLNYVSEFNIIDNPNLIDFKNFSTSDSIDNYFFRINQNAALQTLNGLTSFRNIIGAEIMDNPKLNTLAGLDNVKQINNLKIVNNDALKDLALPKLASMDSVYGTINIENNSSLKKITGFPKLNEVTEYINIIQNDSLEYLNMPALKTIGTLYVSENPRLKSVEGFDSLEIVNRDLNIYLTHSDSLGGGFNDSSKINGFNLLNNIDGNCYTDALYIDNAFNKLIDIKGNLYYHAKRLDSYHKLNRAGGLQYLSPIEYLNAFDNMVSVGGLLYWWNESPIVQNLPLKLLKCEGQMSVDLKKSLESNAPLLANLSLIQGELVVTPWQTEPISFNIFPKLTEIDGGIYIKYNKYLPYLKGLEHLKIVKKGIQITNNENLFDCSALCEVFKNANITGLIDITGNPFPCETKQEITAWCDTVWVKVTPEITPQSVKIYPNPIFEAQELTIEMPENYSFPAEMTLLDSQGKIMEQQIIQQPITQINLGTRHQGLFFIKLRDKNGMCLFKKISVFH